MDTEINATTPPEENKISFKNNSNKKKIAYIAAGVVTLLVLVTAIIFMLYQDKPAFNTEEKTADNTKQVENNKEYTSYLEREKELYPGEKTPEVIDMLTQKVLDDQLILESGVKEGIIKDFPTGNTISTVQYLQRTQQVQFIKDHITKNENGLEGELVSIWFYNNGKIGPQGYEKSKQLALAKITALYDRVKKKEITMKQAGEIIAKDKSIASLDEAYVENSYTAFHFSAGHPITFWKPFDDQLITLKPGEISAIYLGDSFSPDGTQAKDGVYVFGTITKRTDTASYNSFDKWLNNQKELAKKSSFIPDFLKSVFADDNPSNCCAIDESLYESKCGHGCPPFKGVVKSKTGAPLKNIKVKLTNKLYMSQETTTNEKGEYFFEAVKDFSCGTSPMVFSAEDPNAIQAVKSSTGNTLVQKIEKWFIDPVPNAAAATPTTVCDVVSLPIGNLVSVQSPPTVTCGLSPSEVTANAPLQPSPACGKVCNRPADCNGAQGGCTSCLPDGTGKNVCSAIACGTSCTKDADCDGAKDSCNACISGKCAAFDQNLCGCDGFEATALSFPGNMSFDAYAKVVGANIPKAQVAAITFKLSESDKSNPNAGTIIAESAAIKPEVVSSDDQKVRYKASWNLAAPRIQADKLYRVYSEIKCRPKSSSQADAGLQMQSKVLGVSNKIAQSFNQGNELQLTTANFIKKGETDSCKFLFFEYDQSGGL